MFLPNLMHSAQMTRFTHADLYRFLLFHARPLWLQICYFVSASAAGFFLLKLLPMKHPAKPRPADLDLFFMSVSANTVASMDTIEMEEFSNLQLATLIILMLTGGEVFVSLLCLHFSQARSRMSAGSTQTDLVLSRTDNAGDLGCKSTRRLFHVVLGYMLVVHSVGFALVLAYVSLVPDAGDVLRGKGLNASMFAIFTTVSSLANCGFVPTSENMVAFKACSGLLLLVAAQVLVGNTMYPPCLWLVLWALKRVTGQREYGHILREGAASYEHLFPGPRAASIGVTTLSLLALQVVVFCSMEWTSAGLTGLSPYRKIVAGVFQAVNSRYAGESVVDLGAISPAVLVLVVAIMYVRECMHNHISTESRTRFH